MDERQIRWKARRGMKELDAMLTGWMDAHWAHADPDQRASFAALLDLQDPTLWDLLSGRAQPSTEQAGAVAAIRACAGL
jgi:antitoxin CptB